MRGLSPVVIASFLVAACSTVPAEPPPLGNQAREGASRGCEWDAGWASTHSRHDDRLRYCMAKLGFFQRSYHFVTIWTPPSAGTSLEEPQDCMSEALELLARIDTCMITAGFDPAPDRFLPYSKTAAAQADIKSQFRSCAPSNWSGRFHTEFASCLSSRGWISQERGL